MKFGLVVLNTLCAFLVESRHLYSATLHQLSETSSAPQPVAEAPEDTSVVIAPVVKPKPVNQGTPTNKTEKPAEKAVDDRKSEGTEDKPTKPKPKDEPTKPKPKDEPTKPKPKDEPTKPKPKDEPTKPPETKTDEPKPKRPKPIRLGENEEVPRYVRSATIVNQSGRTVTITATLKSGKVLSLPLQSRRSVNIDKEINQGSFTTVDPIEKLTIGTKTFEGTDAKGVERRKYVVTDDDIELELQ